MEIKKLTTKITSVDQIVHIADIHIRPYKRHVEFKQVFENLYKSINSIKTENTIIAILGDLFHAKTEMTPELISIVSNLLINLSNICPLIIIPGNHDCFTGDHEILTRTGWVSLKEYIDLNKNEEVTTFNLSTNELSFEMPTAKIKRRHNGKLLHYNGKDAEFICTPTHRILYKQGNNIIGEKIYEKEAKFLINRKINIPLNGIINNDNYIQNKFARLAGFSFAEGTFVKKYFNKNKRLVGRIQFHLKKDREINYICNIMSQYGIKIDINKYIKKDGAWTYSISGQLATDIFKFFNTDKDLIKFTCLNKNIPWTILNEDINSLKSFMDGYLHGDGCKNKNFWSFCSMNKQSIEILSTISRFIGARSRTYFKKIFYGKYENSKRLYGGSCTINNLINSTHCNFSNEIDYNDYVYCLTTPNSTLLIRYKDKIFISGNCNLNNPNRLDSISPIVNNLNRKNIFYLKQGGVYELADIYFCHLSIFDVPKNYIRAVDVPNDKRKIALFHGIVDKSTNEFGYNLRNELVDKTIFSGYNITLLGDIHKPQSLSEKIVYPGSLVQNNYGEGLTHGYVLWTLKNESNKFITIENEYGYYTLEIKNGVVPDATDVPKKCRMRVHAYDMAVAELNDALGIIKKKYNPIEITINRISSTKYNISTEDRVKLNILNIQDISYQNDLIETYILQNNTIDQKGLDTIREINTNLNSSINTGDFVKNVRWSPLKFEWSNMFSYGENNIIDFTNLRGIVGLFGVNVVGKTSAVDSLSFCLFDKTSRDFKPINIINNKSNYLDCKIKFLLSNTEYSIHRHVYKNKKGDPMYKVEFSYIDDAKEVQSLNGENRWDTNKNIYSRIGTFEDFILTAFSMQGKNANFLEKGHSERKDLLIQFMGLSLFDSLYEMASNKYKDKMSSLKTLQHENWADKLIKSERKLTDLETIYSEKILNKQNISNTIKSIETNINELREQLVDIDEDLDINDLIIKKHNKEKEIKELNNEITKIIDGLEKSRSTIEEYNARKSMYKSLNIDNMIIDVNNLEKNKTELLSKIDTFQVIVDNELDKMDKLKELEYDLSCKYCMNNIFVKDAIATKQKLEEDSEKLNALKTDLNLLKDIIESKSNIKEQYEEYQMILKDIPNLEVTLHREDLEKITLQSSMHSKEHELGSLNDRIEKYNYNKVSIENNNRINTFITELNREVHKYDKPIRLLDTEILNIFGKIKVEESNQKAYKLNIEKQNSLLIETDCYKVYLDAIKRDGIPYDLISKIIPTLETEINNILNQIVDFSIMISLDESKNINMYIVYDENNFWPLEMTSGMERVISSIAIRVALINISELPRSNFLILDELFGVLDADNLNNVSMLMDYLKTQFDFVLLISHIDDIKEIPDVYIDLQKINGFSSISHN